MKISNWMSWVDGVDLVAVTKDGLQMPNVILHVARMVHTPVGSAPSGMILWAPNGTPEVMGFISTDLNVAKFFGPKIFAGTPFEQAPALQATIEISTKLPDSVSAKIVVNGVTFETQLSGLKAGELINRAPAAMPPFAQQGVEHAATKATLKVNGKDVSIIVPPLGISGGPAAVYAPCGVYAR
jgi:hypothetical protein